MTPPHVRVLPQEPDPAAQPVVERPASEPAALVGASAAPERPPPPPESKRKPTPSVRVEAPPVERVVSKPPEPEVEDQPVPAPKLPPAPVLAAAPEPEPERQREPEPVTALPLPATPREWNLWDLERLSRERGSSDLSVSEERDYLLMYLRDFATPEGTLPADFDGLVRESFGELIATSARS